MDSAETSSSSLAVVPAQQQSIPGQILWPEAPSIIQNFSLPPSIMYYMAKNPSSPELYKKMIKSCKYFFEKNPILVVADMYGNPTKICSNDECEGDNYLRCCVEIGNKNISSKFWLTHCLYLTDDFEPENVASLLRPKVYRCDIKKIHMWDKRVMYENFKFLAASVVDVELLRVEMVFNDGKAVALESIIEAIPNIKKFKYEFSGQSDIITASTMKNITKLMNLGQLKLFRIIGIPSEALNVDDLSAFIKNYKDTKLFLDFDDNFSEEYKARLDGLIDTVIASEVPNRMIEYDGQDGGKLQIMAERFDGSY